MYNQNFLGRAEERNFMILEHKTVIITGASGGIGEAIVQRFRQENANVVLFGRNEKQLQEVANRAGKGRVLVIAGNVNSSEDRQRLLDTTLKQFGRIDIVVPCAGILEFLPLAQTTEETLMTLFHTNFFSVVALTREITPHLMRQGGSIVYISSSIANGGFPQLAAYAATKGALNSFMRCMAVELAEHYIGVNSVLPGPTQTGMWAKALPDEALAHVGAQILPRLLTGQFGDPHYVADTVVWLARTPTVRGQEIIIDGGYSIN
jgi:NAD(P)-dependent dehydrogenase (short-subunit alcohol dehydrogenase family)